MASDSLWAKVNVVCVSYNNEETIESLLSNITDQHDLVAEVVIHDNGSLDETARIVAAWSTKHPEVAIRLIRSSNIGFGQGVHGACRGLADASLPTLCINPDAILSDGTMGKMIEILNADSSIGVVTAPLVRADGQLDSASIRKLPRLGPSILYSLFGRLMPRSLRYNSTTIDNLADGLPGKTTGGYAIIEATTGALMLVNPLFRGSSGQIFDPDYWMYGEDLQLCKDAADEGFKVVIIDWPPSLHLKGISSGWPRNMKSNKAFHEALYIYYVKNMSQGWLDRKLVRTAVAVKFLLSQTVGDASRRLKNMAR